jgi:hypothetical protein
MGRSKEDSNNPRHVGVAGFPDLLLAAVPPRRRPPAAVLTLACSQAAAGDGDGFERMLLQRLRICQANSRTHPPTATTVHTLPPAPSR